ncbi:MAG TPA: saccharopine dehydrogenase NADP-binding domain-containing protein [Gemmatimonadaceae bacterium]|nr:saccharopine dehydrogenase NADP-binding domain-containing protein [Gemmatimonadaceae bacterium]
MPSTLLLYGVTGYTGRLILAECLARGLRPVLSGRNAAAVGAIAAEHGLESRPAALDDPAALDRALSFDGVRGVLHCAGPFSLTSAPMLEACLRNGAHYLDITGEISVFEQMAATNARAEKAGVTLLPGVGFDVVPSDCLAAHLAQRLPGATSLTLAFTAGVGVSHGTALTMAMNAGLGGAVRRGGRIVRVSAGWLTREVPFADRRRTCVSIPWGDVSTAWYSTGIPDITVFAAASSSARRGLRLSRALAPLLATRPVQWMMKRAIDHRPAGPDAAQRSRAVSQLWGEVTDASGKSASARLTAPDGYSLTALTAVEGARRVLAGGIATGFQTPSRAFGADFILGFAGVRREDVG